MGRTTPLAPLHFSPALALFAPLVIVWPSPIALLVAQAVRWPLGLAPLMRATSSWTAWVVAVTYGLAPAFGALFGFDFHEVALAVPLLAFSMAAMLRGDHRAAVLWAMPLVLVKEDLGLTVAALGVVVFLRGSRRWGTFAMVFGAVTFVVLLVWVLPVIQADASFAEQVRARGSRARPGRRSATGARQQGPDRAVPAAPDRVCWPCARPLLLVALPTYGWRFVSDRATYWDPWYQYDAVLVPIAVAAMIEGAAPGRRTAAADRSGPRPSPRRCSCCPSRRSPRPGTPTSGTRRPAPPRSTGCSTASRTTAWSPPPTPSARGSRCARS